MPHRMRANQEVPETVIVGVWFSTFEGRCAAPFNERAASIPPQSGCVQPNEDESESISMYCGIILCKSNIDGYEKLEMRIY